MFSGMTNENAEARGRAAAWGPARMNVLERFGALLSIAQIRRAVGPMNGRDVADIGCGQRGGVSYSLVGVVKSLTLVDFSLDETLKNAPRVRALEGVLPDVL